MSEPSITNLPPPKTDPDPIWIGLAVYAIGWAWAFVSYRHQINPDGISYISIAQDYLVGDLRSAVNAYWSPLYSWLLVPLLAIKVPSLLAPKVISFLTGLAAYLAMSRISQRLQIPARARLCVGLTLAPILLFLGASVITPDLLTTTLTLFYLAHVTRHDATSRPFHGLIAGAWGGIAYLAKAYAMWFFLGHFVLTTALDLVQSRNDRPRRWRTLQCLVTGLLAFAVIQGAWIGALAWKYHCFTTGSTASYNHALNGPSWPAHFYLDHGLIEPPNPNAVSSWEDPTDILMPQWSPFDSKENFRHQIRLVRHNTSKTIGMLEGYSPLAVPGLLAAMIVTFRRRTAPMHRAALLLIAAVFMYPVGYLFLHVEPRFLSLMALLILILGIFAIYRLCPTPSPGRCILITIFAVSFIVAPIRYLWRERGSDLDALQNAAALADVIPAGSRVAAIGEYYDTEYLAFHDRLKFLGLLRRPATAPEMLSELKTHRVDYLFVWGDNAAPVSEDATDLARGKVKNLRVYRVAQ